MSMDFDLISFTLCPTVEVFNKCRKDDLLQVADFFNIPVFRDVSKRIIKIELQKVLVVQGILPDESEEGGSGDKTSVIEGSDVKSLPVPETKLVELPLAIKLKELDLLVKKQEYDNQMLHELELEIDCELERRLAAPQFLFDNVPVSPSPLLGRSPATSLSDPAALTPGDGAREAVFDVSRYIKLVPKFREAEVDSYFITFERVAVKLRWPKDMWALLLQCNLEGKAQEVCSSLPIEQSLDYDVVKTAVLRAYELVPEAYRQKFRDYGKSAKKTFVEIAREKGNLFDKWCSSKVSTFEQLRELILVEDFKSCLPENIVVHLNEKKVAKLSDAAVITDEFVLTHRRVFPSVRQGRNRSPVDDTVKDLVRAGHLKSGSLRKHELKRTGDKRVCFYCLDPGHLISECRSWKQNNSSTKA